MLPNDGFDEAGGRPGRRASSGQVWIVVCTILAMGMLGGSAGAQIVWDVFNDAESGSACGIINTVNSELVVLTDTAQLMIVSRTDTILVDTFVDADNFVFFEGEPAGVIEFAEDDDGFRTLWWLTFDGRVVELDPFTAEPSVSDAFPDEFENVPCDACAFVDNPPFGACEDEPIPVDDLIVPILDLCGVGLGGQAMLAMTFFGYIGLRSSRRSL